MTEKSLREAFAGESAAHMKYLMFSEIAEKEGYPNLSRLFRAIAYAEQVHATNHARNLGEVGSTADNLKVAIEGETYEAEEMYPAFRAVAELQSESGARRGIEYALEAERIHADLYARALERVKGGEDLDDVQIYICPVCGYTHVGTRPDRCPVCNIPGERFRVF
jgi:rubrerythrin